MNIFDELLEKNEFPIVFIGSGISKRYLNNFPTWTSLLEEFWSKIGKTNFYGEFNNIREDLRNKSYTYTNKEIDHYSNIKMGTIIEIEFNKKFNDGLITINDLTPKESYEKNISPFKHMLSTRFSEYNLIEHDNFEYESFKKMLSKTQIILTTNYDTFLEDTYNEFSEYEITKFIGQQGFFNDSIGISEIFKIHGCVSNPNSIVITESDYEKFEENSVLISAKIISLMIHSPIIFMGYSLTDLNIRNIIKSFTKSLDDQELQKLERRIYLIERNTSIKGFKMETVNDRDLGCKLNVIKTDDFKSVYDEISKINQGIAPSEIRKYHHVIKKLVIDRGKQGSLDSVLLAPEQLDLLENNLQNKNLAIAIGDAKYIFQSPDIISYCVDYISEADEINTEIRLRFVAAQQPKARLPMNKLLDIDLINSSKINEDEKRKLINKIEEFSNFDKQYKTIIQGFVVQSDYESMNQIINLHVKRDKIYETLSYYINNFDMTDIKKFLIRELESIKEKGEHKISTGLRRLLLLYDIKQNKKDND